MTISKGDIVEYRGRVAEVLYILAWPWDMAKIKFRGVEGPAKMVYLFDLKLSRKKLPPDWRV